MSIYINPERNMESTITGTGFGWFSLPTGEDKIIKILKATFLIRLYISVKQVH